MQHYRLQQQLYIDDFADLFKDTKVTLPLDQVTICILIVARDPNTNSLTFLSKNAKQGCMGNREHYSDIIHVSR